ncbi:MAG TPA: phage tail sheath C-terminal domain-containing protein, partial [Rhodanobacter sp.]|nr:phage tail sheath C-terminal domain-containing protein [Rhodanobacter sp.]
MQKNFLHGVQVIDINDGARTISVASSSVIGIVGTAPNADPAAFPLNTPVLIAGSPAMAAKLITGVGADNGTLPDAVDSIFDQSLAVLVVVRVDVGTGANADAATMANVVGGVNAITGNYEGVHAFLSAESIAGVKPRILIAPGFTHQAGGTVQAPTTNPAVAEMQAIANSLRAVIIQDGPNTTDSAAMAAATTGGSKRTYLVDPVALKLDATGATVQTYGSSCAAGVIAATDNTLGWWASPSNQPVNGIIGTARPIPFSMGDNSCAASLLNAANVATIIRQNGFRLWGNRTLSADPKWAFLCVVRTADIIADSLQAAHLWAVDKGITKNYVSDVQEGVNAFLRDLKTQGAILGGHCWVDRDLNSDSSIAQGKVLWDFDFTPV